MRRTSPSFVSFPRCFGGMSAIALRRESPFLHLLHGSHPTLFKCPLCISPQTSWVALHELWAFPLIHFLQHQWLPCRPYMLCWWSYCGMPVPSPPDCLGSLMAWQHPSLSSLHSYSGCARVPSGGDTLCWSLIQFPSLSCWVEIHVLLSFQLHISLPCSMQSSGRGIALLAPSDSGCGVGLSPTFWSEWVLPLIWVCVAVQTAVWVGVWVWVLVAAVAGTALALHPALNLHAVSPVGLAESCLAVMEHY